MAALAALGITEPFPIQNASLPDSLAGRDVLGRGRTGSGKTYAFLLPTLAHLAAHPKPRRPGRFRALVLAPTRELAAQIEASAAPLAQALSLTVMTVFGGVGQGRQVAALRGGVDIVVACPGRLEDLAAQGHARLDAVEVTVLDEADHMADLGFLPTVRRLLDQTPRQGQRMLFSATLDAGVDVLVNRYLDRPTVHSVDSAQSPVATMTHHVLHVRPDDRLPVLVDLVAAPGRTLVFTRTKRGAQRLTQQLIAHRVPAVELHGNLAQNARTRNLAAFSDGTATTLVATDIAARGLHIDEITRVIHADPPIEHKAYLHRSGRTARAGAGGTVLTLMTDDQVADVRDLTRRAGITATTTRLAPGHPLLAELAPGERTFSAALPPGPSTVDLARRPGGGSGRRPARSVSPVRSAGAARGAGSARGNGSARVNAPARGSGNPSGAARSGGAGQSGGAARSTGSRPAAVASKPSGAAAFSSSTKIGRR